MPKVAITYDEARRLSHGAGLAVFAGGVAGALARAGLAHWLPQPGGGWPWSTFVANTAGTALLAYFATRLGERLPPATYRGPLLGTGLCGALTTFSTLQLEALQLAHRGHSALAAAYFAATLATGLATMLAITKLTRRLRLR